MYKLFSVLFISFSLFFQAHSQNAITGIIKNTSGSAIENASVHLLNTNYGAFTDSEGKFSIAAVAQGKLEVSKVGYASTIISVVSNSGELSITLSESYTQLDAVVVTAQKQEEDVQLIPSSITALSSKQIENYRIWNTQDITAIVPNLYTANPGDNRNVTSIRGITSTSYDPAVTTYVDGVNQFGLDTYIAQLFDVERIEVLRGSQGSLYGRNAMGGVINIITKQPTNRTTGFAELNFGNYGQQRYSAGVRMPLVKNKLFLGVSGIYDQTDGFYKNLFNNSNFDSKNSFTGNYFLKFLASSRLAFTLNIKHNDNRNSGAFPLVGSFNSVFDNPFNVNQNAVTTMVDNVFNGSLTASYSHPLFNATSQSSYQSNYRYYKDPIDGDFSPYEVYSIINNYGKDWNNVKVLTQEFKFTSPSTNSSPFKWTAGIFGYTQDSPTKQATHITGKSKFSSISTTKGSNYGMAAFGQATYSLNEKLDLTGGLRYDYENKQLTVKGEFQPDGSPTAILTRPDTTGTVSYGAISPKATLAYHLDAAHQLYGTYSRGFRTGGLTSDLSTPLYLYKPEYSNTIEVASKNTFLNNLLKLNVTAFHTEVTDAQIPTLILPQAITVTKNAGTLVSEGLELETAATPLNGLQIEWNAGVNNAAYKKLVLSQNNQPKDASGNHALFTPSFTSMIAVQYQLKIGTELKALARVEWQSLGDQYFDLANKYKQAGYNLINARVGFTFTSFELMFWVRNLTDKKYVAYAYDFGAAHLGNPKNYGITLRKSF